MFMCPPQYSASQSNLFFFVLTIDRFFPFPKSVPLLTPASVKKSACQATTERWAGSHLVRPELLLLFTHIQVIDLSDWLQSPRLPHALMDTFCIQGKGWHFSTEALFLDVIGTKDLRVFLLCYSQSPLLRDFTLPPSPPEQNWFVM